MAAVAQLELNADTLTRELAAHDRSADSPVVLRVPTDLEAFALELLDFMGAEHVFVEAADRQGWAVAPIEAVPDSFDVAAAAEAETDEREGVRLRREAEQAEGEGDAERAAALRAEADAREGSHAALDAAQAELDGDGDGRSGELAAEAEAEDTHIAPDQLLVYGTAKKARKWAGKQPATGTITLKGVRFDTDGAFETGTRFRFEGEAIVVREGKKDVLDKETLTASEAVAEYAAEVVDFSVEEE